MKYLKKYFRFSLPALMLGILVCGTPMHSATAYGGYGGVMRNQNQLQYINQARMQTMSEVQLRQLIQLLTQLQERLLRLYSFQDDNSELEIATRFAADVSDDDALLRGRVVDFGDSDFAEVWFEYDTTSGGFDNVTVTERIEDDEDGYFERRIVDLEDDTTYYYRAIGEDEDGNNDYGSIVQFRTGDSSSNDDDDDDDDNDPDVSTRSVAMVTDDSADLRGTVDMNGFENGEVFFVYGEDEDQVDDVADDFDTYDDVDEDGNDLQKVLVDSSLDSDESYVEEVRSLDNDTTYYFAICVGYEDEDGDDVLRCGDTRSFTTDS